jgi:hypothetical protein
MGRGRLKEMQWVDMKALTGLAGEDPRTNFFIEALADALEPGLADLNKAAPINVFCLEIVHAFQKGLVLVRQASIQEIWVFLPTSALSRRTSQTVTRGNTRRSVRVLVIILRDGV